MMIGLYLISADHPRIDLLCAMPALHLTDEEDAMMKARKRYGGSNAVNELTIIEQRFLHEIAAEIGYAFDGLTLNDIDPHEWKILRSAMLRVYRRMAAVNMAESAKGEALRIMGEYIVLHEDEGEPYTKRRADLALDLLQRWSNA